MCFSNSPNQQRINDKIDEIEDDPNKNFHTIIDDDLVLFDGNCKYLDLENCNTLQTKNSTLNILHLNVHSLPNKCSDLKELADLLKCNQKNIDLILLCETFINDVNLSQCKLPGFKLEEKHRITKSKGGVAVLVNDQLRYKPRNDLDIFKEGKFESCFIEIICKGKNVIAGEVYRIPGTDEKEFLEDYKILVEKISKENKEIIIGTDQNLDYLKINRHKNTAKFLETNLAAGLTPTINKPTRITHSSATLIDNIYISNGLCDDTTSAILLSDISDHFPCLCLIGNNRIPDKRNPLVFKARKLSNESMQNISNDLGLVDWAILDTLDANKSYDYISEKISASLDQFSPERTVTIPYNRIIREPWMTQDLLKMGTEKSKLYRKCIGVDKTNPKYQAYIANRNLYNTTKRQAKRTYFGEKIEEFRRNSKKLWGILNLIIGKCHDKSLSPDSFLIDGKMTTNPMVISDGFCNYFSNVGKNLAAKIPNSRKSFQDYLGNDNVNDNFFLMPTTEYEVEKLILTLPSKTSSGYDSVSNILLKELSSVLKGPLATVFNKSISDGVFPEKMKISEIVPLYKSKEKHIQSNYRPIALLPVMSKVLEKIVYNRLYSFLTKKNILFESQYGFRKDHNTIHAVSELIGNIVKGFDNKKIAAAIFLDLSKAFDTLKHSTLLAKLEHYGVRGLALQWFTSYLSNRKQYVKYNETKSKFNTIDLEYGVPQGSVLGPLLYLIFCNDLHKVLEKTSIIMFADDTTIYATNEDLTQLISSLKHDFELVIDWFKANKLSLNLAKTNYVIFSPKNTNIDYANAELVLDGEAIKPVYLAKFLGIFVDNHITWKSHIEHLCSQLSKGLYILKNSKNYIPNWARKMLYYSFFYSHITYGLLLWGPMCTKANHKRIEKSQKRAVRLINNTNYNAHTNPLFKASKILKFEDCVQLELCKQGAKFSKNLLPNPVAKLFQSGRDFHNYNTRNRNNPIVSRHKSALYNQSFLCKCSTAWNNVDAELRNSKSVESFARRFKKTKISRY